MKKLVLKVKGMPCCRSSRATALQKPAVSGATPRKLGIACFLHGKPHGFPTPSLHNAFPLPSWTLLNFNFYTS